MFGREDDFKCKRACACATSIRKGIYPAPRRRDWISRQILTVRRPFCFSINVGTHGLLYSEEIIQTQLFMMTRHNIRGRQKIISWKKGIFPASPAYTQSWFKNAFICQPTAMKNTAFKSEMNELLCRRFDGDKKEELSNQLFVFMENAKKHFYNSARAKAGEINNA